MATEPATGEVQDEKHHHQDDGHDAEHLHPAWRTRGGVAVMRWAPANAGVVGVLLGRVSHVHAFGAAETSATIGRVYETLCIESNHTVCMPTSYTLPMPKLWNDTIEAHRREVRDAILATTASLVNEHGLHAVTMSQIAAETGIGRATLYKYFSDVEAILVAWHERQVAGHLEHLIAVRDEAGDAMARLEGVLMAYALMSHEHHASELSALLHQGRHVARARQQLAGLIRDLLAEAAAAGQVRSDVAPAELAGYCLHALAAASSLSSKAAVRRLVTVTLAGLDPPTPIARRG